jgi:hypothetical protein
MSKNTRLAGHTLRNEGQPFVKDRITGGWCRNMGGWKGVALCSCGAASPELVHNNERKRWHRDHKEEVRAALSASPDSSKES